MPDIKQNESTVDRVKRIQEFVEEMIELVSEHPECELKKTWERSSFYHKAEFIKDIQSIANSAIPVDKEKYIAVGVDESTREIIGCNHQDFNEAHIRQLLEGYLDPVPEFEVLHLKSSKNIDYVVVRIPYQVNKPFIAKTQLMGEQKRIHLQQGEIWVKPGGLTTGSTGKRLVTTRSEIIAMIDHENIINKEVNNRLNQLLPEIRLVERTRIQANNFSSLLILSSSDQDFESYFEQILADNNAIQFNILIERIRDNTVQVWENKIEEEILSQDKIKEIKENIFLPNLKRLVQIGMLIIKFSASEILFTKVADLLIDIFNVSNLLFRHIPTEIKNFRPTALEDHNTHTVPAVESILAAYLLMGFEIIRKKQLIYSKSFFPRVVEYEYPSFNKKVEVFYLFFPYFYYHPNRYRELLALERYGIGGYIQHLIGNREKVNEMMLQADCFVDWLSFLGIPELNKRKAGEIETISYFEGDFPDISVTFRPSYIYYPLHKVNPLISQMLNAINNNNHNFLTLDNNLANVLSKIDIERRKKLLGRFVLYMQEEQAKQMIQRGRMPFNVYWPDAIQDIVDLASKEVNKEYKWPS